MARDLLSVPWEPIRAILELYEGHVGVHFGLPVANLTFLKAFGASVGLSFGLQAQFWIDFRSNLAPPSLQTSSMGTAECAERLNQSTQNLADFSILDKTKTNIAPTSKFH